MKEEVGSKFCLILFNPRSFMCLSGRETKTHSEFTRRKNLDIYRVFRELCQEIQPSFPCIISYMKSKNTEFVCIWEWKDWEENRTFNRVQSIQSNYLLVTWRFWNKGGQLDPLLVTWRFWIKGCQLVTWRFWMKGGQLNPPVGNVTFLDERRSVGPPCW